MKTDRRRFLTQSALGAGALGALPLLAAAPAAKPPSFLSGKPGMKLGTVTYNLAQDWDIETIIKNCEAAKFEGVELRTSHAHKVEVNLTKDQREEVKQRFQNSSVELMGLGSAFDYHTPDPDKLKKDIAATKEYILLAHDVGATGVKVRPNGLPKEVPKEKTLQQIGLALRELGKFRSLLELQRHGPGRRRLRQEFRSREAQDLLGPPARFVPRRLPIPETVPAAQRDSVRRLLPGGNPAQPGPGTRDEVFPFPLAGLPGFALKRVGRPFNNCSGVL